MEARERLVQRGLNRRAREKRREGLPRPDTEVRGAEMPSGAANNPMILPVHSK